MLRTLLLTIALGIAFFVAERYFVVPWLHPDWMLLLVFFLSVSYLTHRLVQTGLQNDAKQLVPMYLATTVARLVLGLAFIGFILFRGIEHRQRFVLDFLALYIFYTGFEIWGLSRKLRRDS